MFLKRAPRARSARASNRAGVTGLQDWNTAFPIWPRLSLHNFARGLDDKGIDLLEVRRRRARADDARRRRGRRARAPPPRLSPRLTRRRRAPSPPRAQKFMAYNPSERISSRAALSHPFFDDLDKDAI